MVKTFKKSSSPEPVAFDLWPVYSGERFRALRPSCILGTQERVRNSRGKRAIGVRAIEVLLLFGHSPYIYLHFVFLSQTTDISQSEFSEYRKFTLKYSSSFDMNLDFEIS